MDYGGVLKEAWRVTQARQILGLTAVSLASTLLFGAVVLIVIALLGGLLVFVGLMGFGGMDPIAQEQFAAAMTDANEAMSGHLVPGVVAAVTLFVAWLCTAIADVAAQAGLAAELDRAITGQEPRFTRGMREGMDRWWRTAALIAISAVPSLVVALGYSMALFGSVSALGGAPDEPWAALSIWSMSASVLRPLSVLAQAASVVLAAIVAFALRFAIVDDVPWRPALAQGWALLRARPAQWFAAWIILVGLGSALAWLMSVLVVLVVAVGVAVMLALGAAEDLTRFVTGGVLLVGIVVALLAFVQWPFHAYSAAYWSVVWRTMTGRDVRFGTTDA